MTKEFKFLDNVVTVESPVNINRVNHLKISLTVEEEDGEGYNGRTNYKSSSNEVYYDCTDEKAVIEFFKDAVKFKCLEVLSTVCQYTFIRHKPDARIAALQSALDKIDNNIIYSDFMIEKYSAGYYYIDEAGAVRNADIEFSEQIKAAFAACEEIHKNNPMTKFNYRDTQKAEKIASLAIIFEKIVMLLDAEVSAKLSLNEPIPESSNIKKNKI